jgi:hypothetical protein
MPFTLKQKEDLSFALALFIRRDRRVAREVTAQALDDYQSLYYLKGKKRDYNWTQYAFPLTENYALQHQVFSVATQVRASALCDQSEASMITYYLATMLSVCGAKNPFHVTAGFSMRVYDYTDVQASCIYEALKELASLPQEMYSNRDQFRRWKGRLSRKIKERFGDLIEMNNPVPASGRQRSQVNLCGGQFIPWTENVEQDYYDLTASNRTYPNIGEIGVACIYTVVHQERYRNLVEMARDFFSSALERNVDGKMDIKGGLPPAEKKLSLPKFMVSSNHSTPDPGPPFLGDDERDEIRRMVAALQRNKRVEKGDWIVCYADTEEVCRFRADQGGVRFEVDDTTRLMKFCAENSDRKKGLATIPLNLDEGLYEDGPVSLEYPLNGRKKLSFDLSLRRDGDGDVDGAYVAVEYSEAKSILADLFRKLFPVETPAGWRKLAWAAGAAAVLLILGFFLTRNLWNSLEQVAITPTPTPEVKASPDRQESPDQIAQAPSGNPLDVHPSPSATKQKPLRYVLNGASEFDKHLLASIPEKIGDDQFVNDQRANSSDIVIECKLKPDSRPDDSILGFDYKVSDPTLPEPITGEFVYVRERGNSPGSSLGDHVAAKIKELLKDARRRRLRK